MDKAFFDTQDTTTDSFSAQVKANLRGLDREELQDKPAKFYEHMMLHLLDNLDTPNCRLVSMRADPKTKQVEHAQKICKLLSELEFENVHKILEASDPLQTLLKRYLQQHLIPHFICETYSKLDQAYLLKLMGCTTLAAAQKLMVNHKVTGDKFVTVERNSVEDAFSLDQRRMEGLKSMVQFLEKN